MAAKPTAARVGDFVNLEQLGLMHCEEVTVVPSDLSLSPGPDPLIRCLYRSLKMLDFGDINERLGQPLVLE